jgi:hypothetical protein
MKNPYAVFRLIFVAVGFLPLVPLAQAVTPAPDGGYPGGNTAEGQQALLSLTSGTYNTAVGLFSLMSNTDGQFNTAIGAGALLANTTALNTATGAGALLNNTTGFRNTADGAFALLSNTNGSINSAFGAYALFHNTEGTQNTAMGDQALFTNTTGQDNTAIGYQALFFNDGDPNNLEGSDNCAFGSYALGNSTTGDSNSAFGWSALGHNTIGFDNTAIGVLALSNNTDHHANTAVGARALQNTTGGFNTGLGDQAGFNVTTASNVICIGTGGGNIDNSCFIGNIYSNVQPVIGIDPDYVTIDSNGRLGRSNLNGSSRRFKHDIKPIDRASEVIFALKPVSFRYNKEYDVTQRPFFGLIAEDVAEVDPDLVERNKQGEPESVRYEQINAMLLNEFLKEHKKMQQLEVAITQQRNGFETKIAELKKEMDNVAARSKAQDEGIQKVSAQIGLNTPAPRVVANR